MLIYYCIQEISGLSLVLLEMELVIPLIIKITAGSQKVL